MLEAEQILQAALVLPEGTRAALASDLLASLSGLPLANLDEGHSYDEAMKRDADMDGDESASLTLDQFRTEVMRLRRA